VNKAYRVRNKEKILQYKRNWRQKNLERVRETERIGKQRRKQKKETDRALKKAASHALFRERNPLADVTDPGPSKTNPRDPTSPIQRSYLGPNQKPANTIAQSKEGLPDSKNPQELSPTSTPKLEGPMMPTIRPSKKTANLESSKKTASQSI
jgi:hypothetical protein